MAIWWRRLSALSAWFRVSRSYESSVALLRNWIRIIHSDFVLDSLLFRSKSGWPIMRTAPGKSLPYSLSSADIICPGNPYRATRRRATTDQRIKRPQEERHEDRLRSLRSFVRCRPGARPDRQDHAHRLAQGRAVR